MKNEKRKNVLCTFNSNICKKNHDDILNIIGDKIDVVDVNINELNDFARNKYNSQNIQISINGDMDVFYKIKWYENTKISSNVIFYYSTKMYSIYFSIPGMSRDIFYIFEIMKYMLLEELNRKYSEVIVKIIRVSKDKSFFIISGHLNQNDKKRYYS